MEEEYDDNYYREKYIKYKMKYVDRKDKKDKKNKITGGATNTIETKKKI